MKTEAMPQSAEDSCGSAACSALSAPATGATLPAGGKLFRIATMDCSAEESEIRRALEPLSGIRSLGFQLGARTLKIDASDEALPLVLEAIRKAGFDPNRSKPSGKKDLLVKPPTMMGMTTTAALAAAFPA